MFSKFSNLRISSFIKSPPHSKNMDLDDAASLSKWVADMNLDISKHNLGPQMELVWFPIKLDENGQGELIGEGDACFNLQGLNSSEKLFRSLHISSQSSLPLSIEKQSGKVIVDGKVADCLEPPVKDENNNWLHVEDAAEGDDATANIHHPSEQRQVNFGNPIEHAVEIEGIDEVGVEAEPDDPNNRRAVRHNWRMLLFLLIIFILGYQLVDRYFLNGSNGHTFSSFRSLLKGGGGDGVGT